MLKQLQSLLANANGNANVNTNAYKSAFFVMDGLTININKIIVISQLDNNDDGYDINNPDTIFRDHETKYLVQLEEGLTAEIYEDTYVALCRYITNI